MLTNKQERVINGLRNIAVEELGIDEEHSELKVFDVKEEDGYAVVNITVGDINDENSLNRLFRKNVLLNIGKKGGIQYVAVRRLKNGRTKVAIKHKDRFQSLLSIAFEQKF